MKNVFTILLIGAAFLTNAQTIERDVVSSGGDYYSNPTGQISTTIGEPVIATVSGGGNELTQGFQQSRIDIVGIEDFNKDFTMNVFPNPTAEFVTITIEELNQGLTFAIYTIEGKLIFGDEIKTKETKLNIVDFAKGSYFLKVTDNNELMKTFKILKQ